MKHLLTFASLLMVFSCCGQEIPTPPNEPEKLCDQNISFTINDAQNSVTRYHDNSYKSVEFNGIVGKATIYQKRDFTTLTFIGTALINKTDESKYDFEDNKKLKGTFHLRRWSDGRYTAYVYYAQAGIPGYSFDLEVR